MWDRLPPLNALRALEAAARHLSFTRAAEELGVTAAAVGQQVRSLETHLGIALFRRRGRALMLTESAQAALPELREGFEKLASAVERLRGHDARGSLVVSVEPSFAAKWLVRRLDGFRDAHPDIGVRLDASSRVVDLAREDVDIGIRYGNGAWPGLRVDKLFDESVFPVCAPALIRGENALRHPRDLRGHVLLHDTGDPTDEGWPDWETWLRAAGVEGVDASRGPRFSETSMVVQAAIDGQGVALAGAVLVADDIAAGRLVRPFGPRVQTRLALAYYLVCLEAAADTPKITAFRHWILEQARGRDEDHGGERPEPPEEDASR
ncbi:MAG: transcriptional regulator GcvA [Ectothiorhodospiraceae bacterium]|nr:transcriptional regulator GcvA [Ectothiorhodospiraceae bacterium]